MDILRNDPRLKISLNLKFDKNPSSAEVLDAIQKATSVPLALTAQTETGNLAFGKMTIVNAPAWLVMEQIATTQVKDGKWEQVGDGYRLEGTSHKPSPPPPKFAWIRLAIALAAAVVLALAGGFLIYRRRRQKLTANSTPP